VSTAAGAAYLSDGLTICVVGDVSFLYDSNALWNNNLSPHLRIIVINNGGGNIFRLIDGPQKVQGFEKYFETEHHYGAEYLAQMYQIPYYFCDRADDLDFVLAQFYKPQKGRPAILEIKTDNLISESVYKQYFEFLKSN
jgi:2-succinyl-5-enolpyruvyl-6-hydroxy-3-cyclohexene-1-carboxylate synthase